MFLDIIIGQDEAYLCLRSPEEDRHLKSREVCISSDIAHRPSHGLVLPEEDRHLKSREVCISSDVAHRPSHGLVLLRVGSRASLWIFFQVSYFCDSFLVFPYFS